VEDIPEGSASCYQQESVRKRYVSRLGTCPSTEHLLPTEYFWVDLALSNPLAAEVNLSNVTLVVETKHAGEAEEPLVDIEVVQEVVLSPKETRNVCLACLCWST
jgi:hypothetical protein